jgi:hypothetical protein
MINIKYIIYSINLKSQLFFVKMTGNSNSHT